MLIFSPFSFSGCTGAILDDSPLFQFWIFSRASRLFSVLSFINQLIFPYGHDSHLKSGSIKSYYLIGLLWGWRYMVHAKLLGRIVAHCQHSANTYYCYFLVSSSVWQIIWAKPLKICLKNLSFQLVIFSFTLFL